jgi:hypothetical protein
MIVTEAGRAADEVGDGEGPEQPHLATTPTCSPCVDEPCSTVLVGGIAARAHDDDHALGLRVADVVEQLVAAGRSAAAKRSITSCTMAGRGGIVAVARPRGAWKNTSGFWAVPRITGCVRGQARARNAATVQLVDDDARMTSSLIEELDLGDLVTRCGSRRRSG